VTRPSTSLDSSTRSSPLIRPVRLPERRETEMDGAGWVVLPPPESPSSPPSAALGPTPTSPARVSRTDKVVNKIVTVLAGGNPSKRYTGPLTSKREQHAPETATGGSTTAREHTLSPVLLPRDHAPTVEPSEVDTPIRSNSVPETSKHQPPQDYAVVPPLKDDTVILSLDQPPSAPLTSVPPRSDTSATITADSLARMPSLASGNGQLPGVGGATRTALGDVITPKEMQKVFKLDPDKGTIEWGSRKGAFGE
jgi:hypothetical protein